MPEIVKIQVYYRRWFNSPKDKAELELIEEMPKSPETTTDDSAALKFQVSEIVQHIKPLLDKETGTFYVVFKARKNDGSFGYRTVIPKTNPHKRG